MPVVFYVIFQKRVRVFHRGFKHEKTDESFYCFRVFETLMKHEPRVFEILLQQKKISLNYHLNKFSQFNYYIWDVKYACMNLEKMCMMCMVLSPNCCAVTIFEYSTTEVTLPSCLSVPSEHVASQSKWQSADLDLVKLAKKGKSVRPALFRGNVCI